MKKLFFIFSKSDLLLEKQDDGTYAVPYYEELPVEIKPWTHVMTVSPLENGTEVRALNIDFPNQLKVTNDNLSRHGHEFMGLRQCFYNISRDLYLKAGKCHELLYWDKNSKFCGVCGAPMRMETEISKRCTECGKEVWPQLSTAVIVLIQRGDEVLLVHAKNFKGDYYGLVAGFVETGETLEEAVCREVKEETGLTISNIQYFASQPWPYPCGLMVGFTADYESGELLLQQAELSKGNWFRYDKMPTVPKKLSIARRLIDAWLQKYGVVLEQD